MLEVFLTKHYIKLCITEYTFIYNFKKIIIRQFILKFKTIKTWTRNIILPLMYQCTVLTKPYDSIPVIITSNTVQRKVWNLKSITNFTWSDGEGRYPGRLGPELLLDPAGVVKAQSLCYSFWSRLLYAMRKQWHHSIEYNYIVMLRYIPTDWTGRETKEEEYIILSIINVLVFEFDQIVIWLNRIKKQICLHKN